MNNKLLYKFFEGSASLKEEIAIRKWLESSSTHKDIFLRERRLFDAMLLQGKEDIESPLQCIDLRTILIGTLKIASIVVITCIGSYLYYLNTEKTSDAMQIISVPSGQRVNVTLSDGTNVWLNAGTKLSYPLSFNKKERRVILDGEAYFDVKKGKSFVVETTIGEVKVLGTSFNIESYNAEEFETTLMNGSLKVCLKSNPLEELHLSKNQRCTINNGKLVIDNVEDYTRYRWREGLICFRDESFESIMKEFEKYYGVTVNIKNEKVLTNSYTGKFRHTDGVDYALRILQKDISFTYLKDIDNQVVMIE